MLCDTTSYLFIGKKTYQRIILKEHCQTPFITFGSLEEGFKVAGQRIITLLGIRNTPYPIWMRKTRGGVDTTYVDYIWKLYPNTR